MKTETTLIKFNNLYIKRFYRPYEVIQHTKPNDFWVILNRRVLDLSGLMKLEDEVSSSQKELTALHQMHMFGGTDVTALYQNRTKNHLEMFDLKSQTDYGKINDLFWWNDPVYVAGGITDQERHICVGNKSKGTQCHLTVCEEDSMYQVMVKFFAEYQNESSENIVWRKTESTCCPEGHLSLHKTLTENGLEWDPKNEVVFLWMFHRNELNTCQYFM